MDLKDIMPFFSDGLLGFNESAGPIDGLAEALFQTPQQGIIVFVADNSTDDIGLVLRALNNKGAEILRLKPEAIMGKDLRHDLHSVFPPELSAELYKIYQTRQPLCITFRSGAHKQSLRFHWLVVHDYLLGFFTDISHEEDVAQRLKEAQRWHQDFAALSGDWFWQTDERGIFTHYYTIKESGALQETEMVGYSWRDALDSVRAQHDFPEILAAVQKRLPFYDLAYPATFGRAVQSWLRVSGQPVYDERHNFVGYRGIAKDITVEFLQQQRIAKIARRNELLAMALETLSVSFVVSDPHLPDCPITYVNDTFLQKTGYSREEIIGRNCRFLQGPLTDPEAVNKIREALRAQEKTTVELLNYCKDGTTFWNSLSLAPIFEREGKLSSFFGVQTDVTERREREGRESQRQRIEALGRLAGGVAHEINNLLQPIITLTDAALNSITNMDGETREDLLVVTESARQARAVVRNILLFSRSEKAIRRPTNLYEAVQAALTLCRSLLPSTIMLDTEDIIEGTGQIEMAEGEISHILTNLLINATHAMHGRGTIKISLQEYANLTDAQEPSARLQKYNAVLCVADNGEGMSEAVQKRIFEPFFTTKPAGHGSGLGLAVVAGIIQNLHADIVVQSAPKSGTSFTITLPLLAKDMSQGEMHG